MFNICYNKIHRFFDLNRSYFKEVTIYKIIFFYIHCTVKLIQHTRKLSNKIFQMYFYCFKHLFSMRHYYLTFADFYIIIFYFYFFFAFKMDAFHFKWISFESTRLHVVSGWRLIHGNKHFLKKNYFKFCQNAFFL